MLQTSLSLV